MNLRKGEFPLFPARVSSPLLVSRRLEWYDEDDG